MGRIAARIDLSEAERDHLEGLVRAHSTGQAMVLRARIVLAAGEGLSSKVIRARLKIAANTVGKWRSRFSYPYAEHHDVYGLTAICWFQFQGVSSLRRLLGQAGMMVRREAR